MSSTIRTSLDGETLDTIATEVLEHNAEFGTEFDGQIKQLAAELKLAAIGPAESHEYDFPATGYTHVFRELAAERRRQDEKWGEQNHAPAEWLAVITEEIGEAAQEVCRSFEVENGSLDSAAYRKELVQVAAVTIAAIESFDRQRGGIS